MPQASKQDAGRDIVMIVDEIILNAVKESASDIHFQPLEERMVVRYRVDGILKLVFEDDLNTYKLMISRIKVMANLEITGLSKPQEGNIKFVANPLHKENYVDLRISIFPTSSGESIVMRILETSRRFSSYADLGFEKEQTKMLENIIKKPYGLVLVTGPTGSGKSTTLFTLLNSMNSSERSLVTLEDPVERRIDMVRQTDISLDIGLTFAEGLRYLLRQDPDVIMVGEIRDTETAKIAVQAAVTGHLVLATIHTNNAAGAIIRLINMGVEPFLLASALKFVSSQRLARKLCNACKEEYKHSPEILKRANLPLDMKFYRSKGCDACGNKGVQGRVGIHEVIIVDKAIEDLILTKPTDDMVNEIATERGMMTLRQAALKKVEEGIISLEEAIRLTE
jgi:type IV pilus assembly protein PilB